MPFDHRWIDRCLYKRFTGPVTAEEFLLSVQLTQSDSRFPGLAFSVNDFTEATLPTLSDEQLLMFGAHGISAGFTNAGVDILVITDDPHATHMAERYARLAPFRLRVFASRQLAAAAEPLTMKLFEAAPPSRA